MAGRLGTVGPCRPSKNRAVSNRKFSPWVPEPGSAFSPQLQARGPRVLQRSFGLTIWKMGAVSLPARPSHRELTVRLSHCGTVAGSQEASGPVLPSPVQWVAAPAKQPFRQIEPLSTSIFSSVHWVALSHKVEGTLQSGGQRGRAEITRAMRTG